MGTFVGADTGAFVGAATGDFIGTETGDFVGVLIFDGTATFPVVGLVPPTFVCGIFVGT
jgi:hypothetical protein